MRQDPTGSGYVYALSNPATQLVKIGFSQNVQRRKTELEHMAGGHLVLLHAVQSMHATVLEKRLHARFQTWRNVGEWFCLSPEQIGELRALMDAPVEIRSRGFGIRWRLRELLAEEGVTVTQLADVMPIASSPRSLRVQLYAITSADPAKRPRRFELLFASAVMDGLAILKKKRFDLNDIFEREGDT